ncbi:unnamed protein product [Miscanthus lutarioriparius]|uniref:Uncharacterized protein n=1 Tax=Miscanthus lutarioriparius TaxID=422564 RepID=A0A811Q1J2_9POAL|nr:unnamed protein product [Miscanthus lutarioriparius]
MVEPSKMTPTVETSLRKKVKREINATQAGGKHRNNQLQGSFDVQKRNTTMEHNITRGKAHHEEPDPTNIRKRIPKDEIKKFFMSKGNKVIEATIKGNNVKKTEKICIARNNLLEISMIAFIDTFQGIICPGYD